jgi:hypothetical protein
MDVRHLRCEHIRHGFWCHGRCRLEGTNVTLNPGDMIVSVGNAACSDTNRSLQELIDQAYLEQVLSMVIQDGYTGKRVTVELPPVESDQDSDK